MKAKTKKVLGLLQGYESRNITFIEPDGSWPIVWEQAKGVHVRDADGRKYLDLTAAFGVAAAGHANPRVVRAGQQQMSRLLHAMGDVHPHEPKAHLACELSRITFERWTKGKDITSGKVIFCNSGFEAVEAAFKTAIMATGKPGVIAFTGAYHGLGYGALNATHRDHFRTSFRSQLRRFAHFAPFPRTASDLAEAERVIRLFFRKASIGAILVEPVQARGGLNIPPPEFLPLLRKLCDEHGALLILDEIYTGFGRTGKWFACEHSGVVPDLICLGKALSGGFPISVCVGRAEVMDTAWPRSNGEAIHTSTFLGHPVGCAMALAQIAEIRERNLVEQSHRLGESFLQLLRKRFDGRSFGGVTCEARGIGLMSGIELRTSDGRPAADLSLRLIKEMLHAGYILLPEGEHANIISFTPPLTITERQLRQTVKTLESLLLKNG